LQIGIFGFLKERNWNQELLWLGWLISLHDKKKKLKLKFPVFLLNQKPSIPPNLLIEISITGHLATRVFRQQQTWHQAKSPRYQAQFLCHQ